MPMMIMSPTHSYASAYYSHSSDVTTMTSEGDHSDVRARLAISFVLVLSGGLFAGLTLGLMGLDALRLHVLATSSPDATQKRNALIVLRLLQKGRHWILVSLLLANVVVNESLPIFLDRAIGGGLAAALIATVAIVIFGEVIPQSVNAKYGLRIGAWCAPLILMLMYVSAPIAYPCAKLLDYVLGGNGEEVHTYRRHELLSFFGLHRGAHMEEPLTENELDILGRVLGLGKTRMEEVMTPMNNVLSLSANTILDEATVELLMTSGYSRIPIHEPGNRLAFRGILLVKNLISYDPSRALPVSQMPLSVLPEASVSIGCFEALKYFECGRAHMILLSRTPGVAGGGIGIITLEDVIEEIIGKEIVDETDLYEDNKSQKRASRLIPDSLDDPIRSWVVEGQYHVRQRELLERQKQEHQSLDLLSAKQAAVTAHGTLVLSVSTPATGTPTGMFQVQVCVNQ